MANNRIQIKRSSVTAVPASLQPGELAYSNAVGGTGVLFVGSTDGGTVVPIGGIRNPGTLTANQALVANSTLGINQVQTGNLTLVGTSGTINANGNIGSVGYILYSSGSANAYWGSVAEIVNVAAQYTWSNTQTFQNTITFSSNISIGNASIYTTINSTSFSGTANNSTNFNGQPSSYYTNATNINTGTLPYAQLGVNVVNTTANFTHTGNVTFSSANTVVAGTLSTANIAATNITVSGNLVISGTVESINTTQLIVNSHLIELADNSLNVDVVDSGWFAPAGNATATWYSGLARIAAKSSNNNPYFWLFGSNTNPNTAITIDTSSNSATGTLQSYITPYGVGGAFVINSSSITVTANSTVAVNITANTLALSTVLPGSSGGTGTGTNVLGDILIGTGTSGGWTRLATSSGGDGYVLQINATSGAVNWNTLDGGIF